MLCQPDDFDDDAIIELIGAVFRLAIRDAAQGVRPMPGEMDAIIFLNLECPELKRQESLVGKHFYLEMNDEERKQAVIAERKAKADAQAAFIADLPEQKKRDEASKAADLARQAADKEVAFKQAVLESYIAANGSAWGFEAQWPTLRAELVKQKTLENVGNKAVSGDVVDRFIARMNAR